MKLYFDPEALLEVQQAAAFYEDSQPGLGKLFLEAIEAATKDVIRHPILWRRIKGSFRRFLVHVFPYGLIYAVDKNSIYVAAVMHLKRKPGYWEKRTRKNR